MRRSEMGKEDRGGRRGSGSTARTHQRLEERVIPYRLQLRISVDLEMDLEIHGARVETSLEVGNGLADVPPASCQKRRVAARGELLVPKRKGANATVAVARVISPS